MLKDLEGRQVLVDFESDRKIAKAYGGFAVSITGRLSHEYKDEWLVSRDGAAVGFDVDAVRMIYDSSEGASGFPELRLLWLRGHELS
jgi:hypothetical protein